MTIWQPDWHAGDQCIRPAQGEERRERRKVRQLHLVQPTTPLTTALSMLLDAGVSVLPIVDVVSCAASLTPRLKPCTRPAACCGKDLNTWTKPLAQSTPDVRCVTCAEWGAHRPVCESRHHAAGKGQCLQPPAVGGDDCGSGACPGPDWQPALACFAARDASSSEQLSCLGPVECLFRETSKPPYMSIKEGAAPADCHKKVAE